MILNKTLSPEKISNALSKNFAEIMPTFYEMQSLVLSGINKRYGNLENGHIMLCLANSFHLQTIRQRETKINFDLSFESFWNNFKKINQQTQKLNFIVKSTGMPKETVRRKVKNLVKNGYIEFHEKENAYTWKLLESNKNEYFKIINDEIEPVSRFLGKICKYLNLEIKSEDANKELRKHFSFYWYHFLKCEMEWITMWHKQLKDIDLLLIFLQAAIPAIRQVQKKDHHDLDDIYKNFTKYNKNLKDLSYGVSAASVSSITGIPRASCIRKLTKLSDLGVLQQSSRTKRYYISQKEGHGFRNIVTKKNVELSINLFSNYSYIILNSISQNY